MKYAEQITFDNNEENIVMQALYDTSLNLVNSNYRFVNFLSNMLGYSKSDYIDVFRSSVVLEEGARTFTPVQDLIVATQKLKRESPSSEFLEVPVYVTYEPVMESATGKLLHYVEGISIVDLHAQNLFHRFFYRKFCDMAAIMGVAVVDFYPTTMRMSVIGGRDGYNLRSVSIDAAVNTIVHPEDKEAMWKFLNHAAKDTNHTTSLVIRVYSKTLKEYRSFNVVLIPMTSLKGDFQYYSGYATDTTDRIRKMKEAQDRVDTRIRLLTEAKDKMEKEKEQMDQVLSVMSHDLRTPLNSIRGFSELMVYTDSQEEREEFFKLIQIGVDQMTLLVNDILETTRLDTGNMKYFKLSSSAKTIITNVYAANKILFDNLPCDLILEEPEADYMIMTDSMRLMEILNNYLSNAAKYTFEGTVTMKYEIADDGCYFHVIDTGVGIAPKDCEKVFNRYEMLGSTVNGTGLGLYICREIAKGLDGHVGCKSEKGKGSDFWVWMPKAEH